MNSLNELLEKYKDIIEENNYQPPLESLSKSQRKKRLRAEALSESFKEKKRLKKEGKKTIALNTDVVITGDSESNLPIDTAVTQTTADDTAVTETTADDTAAAADSSTSDTVQGNTERKLTRSEKAQIEFLEESKSKPRIVVDCDFEDKMTAGEITSMGSQLAQAYGKCRQTKIALRFCGLGPKITYRLSKLSHAENWPIDITDKKLTEDNDGREQVYLTGDSEHVLDELDDNTDYVIGGIVDRNRYKGLTYNKAIELGLKTAKIPILESGIELTSSTILTIDQVAHIMMKYIELKDWKEACLFVLPQRRVATE